MRFQPPMTMMDFFRQSEGIWFIERSVHHFDVTKNENENYAAILIDIPDDPTGLTGKLIRNRGYVEGIPIISRYWFGQDGILTINTDYDNNQGQERAWFINDDFRVRVSTTKMRNGINLTTCCSERRCVSPAALAKMVARHHANSSSSD